MVNFTKKSIMRLLMLFTFFAVLLPMVAYPATLPEVRTSWQTLYQRLIVQLRRTGYPPYQVSVNPMDSAALILSSDKDPLGIVLRRTQSLINDLDGQVNLATLKSSFNVLQTQAGITTDSLARIDLFMQACSLQREIAFTNPLFDFDSIIFVQHQRTRGGHICDQYYGFNAKAGNSGLILARHLKTQPEFVNILQNSTVQNGPFAGSKILDGAFLSPDLSFDGKTLAFAWRQKTISAGRANTYLQNDIAKDECYHIFTVNTDGSNLVQLTDTSFDDFDPCFLPNGRIAFVSSRRQGFIRCGSRPSPTFVTFTMKQDGSDIYNLSYHETNEWHPSVANDGMLIFTRWDYVDRDACVAHHLWLSFPDGRDPRAWHGNYPEPLQTIVPPFSLPDGRNARPMAEMHLRAIPNSPRFIGVATPHHADAYGSIIVIDQRIPDDNKMSQVRVFTPDAPLFGDLQLMPDTINAIWTTPWPLSEDYCLANYYKEGGIYLVDKFGNRQLLISASMLTSVADIRLIDPIPLRARQTPPELPMGTWQGERAGSSDHHLATINVQNCYVGDMNMPSGTKIKSMRLMQIFPQEQAAVDSPRIGYSAGAIPRMSLGTVPVEEDGSAYLVAPVEKEFYIQLLDEKGMAVRSMRSGAFVHKGEQMTCIGCHENKYEAAPSVTNNAKKRAPSMLSPEAGGVEPINFYRLVKPVFDRKCVSCHAQYGRGPDMSYKSLQNFAFWLVGTGKGDASGAGNIWLNGDIVSVTHGGSRTLPGKFGAQIATLTKYLDSTHYGVNLTGDEFRRITLWLDANSLEWGAHHDTVSQSRGNLIWPYIDTDPNNPQGVDLIADPTPPSLPAGLAGVANSDRSVLLSWHPSVDADGGVRGYNIYRNSQKIRFIPVDSFYYDNNLAVKTSYSYEVSAVNFGGTESAKTGAIQVETPADTGKPVIHSVKLDKGLAKITVVFSEPVDGTLAQEVSNYRLSGGQSVLSAVLQSDQQTVVLTTIPHTSGVLCTLTVSTIKDLATPQNQAVNLSQPYASAFVIPRTGWAAKYADGSVALTEVAKAFDGDTATMFSSPATKFPHELQIDLGAAYKLCAFRYMPRTGNYFSSMIGDYAFYVSLDGVTWGNPVAQGVFSYIKFEQEIAFAPTQARYVRFVALSGLSPNGQTNMGVAELNLLAVVGDGLVFTSVENDPLLAPSAGTYPNPFNPTINFNCFIPMPTHIQIRIYNTAGRCVADLSNNAKTAGQHRIIWNAKDSKGRSVASGVYVAKIGLNKTVIEKKIILTR